MSRLASRSLDLRRILPAVTLADNAPPSTPGAARRGGGRRGASVANRGVAYPGTARGYSKGEPGVAGRRRGGWACGACGAPCVVDRSAFISFSSAEISGSDDPSAATSGCGVSSLIVVALSRPAHARSGSHLARRAAAGRVPIAGREGRRAARGTPRLSRRRALRYGAVTRSLGS